ncbi:hypothetical protein [Shimia sp.]|uniref:hypothetical protein n=1 Tax=Shimia sp. TaxID=1954381 RepID=UPI0032989A45
MMASGDFRAYLRLLAHKVWADQGDAIKYGLTLQEETITETLLLQMARDLSPMGLNVKMFSRQEEGGVTRKDGTVEKVGNGADWEWFVDLPDCMIGFRVQAKRLFGSPAKDGSYDSFHPGGKQITDLINAASGLNPIYVFYNHGQIKNRDLFDRSPKTTWYGRSSWGCSVATANFMRYAKSKSLSSLRPGMVPWHQFFAIANSAQHGCGVVRVMGKMSGQQQFKLSTKRPKWVYELLAHHAGDLGVQAIDPEFFETGDGEASELSTLEQTLNERNLGGVAYIDFREFESD